MSHVLDWIFMAIMLMLDSPLPATVAIMFVIAVFAFMLSRKVDIG